MNTCVAWGEGFIRLSWFLELSMRRQGSGQRRVKTNVLELPTG